MVMRTVAMGAVVTVQPESGEKKDKTRTDKINTFSKKN
jgi:hypothetical protein